MALLPRHFTSGYQQTFPQVASSRLYYARHTRGTRQPLSGRELPIFLAITRACKPELAEYVRRFLTPTSPFYAVVPRGRMLTSPLLCEKFFHPRPPSFQPLPLLSFYPSLTSSFTRRGAFSPSACSKTIQRRSSEKVSPGRIPDSECEKEQGVRENMREEMG